MTYCLLSIIPKIEEISPFPVIQTKIESISVLRLSLFFITRFYHTGYAIVKSVLSGDTVLLMGSVAVGSGSCH